ncbi:MULTISPECIES: inositol monophosphatase family protein [unclassified Bacillus (in: firmicutes)]|uniref:inositol monophosphatase family protein n=1 Tax=unclassified Bacillus (in: firmicutes) TaxID=185979 RepID=UPI0008EBEC61|nr:MULTISPECIES: inositol monophosphatase family protein [unclassified Bacillus (in: firmicutes)]SFA76289.1 myo-inositol-1(or 4)-monophosphatase [Bacillus sp. UNCCL13]SFQ66168.1 myo-inositol-1(or 4)-monophosphatase [Bacillus sp. cl95]
MDWDHIDQLAKQWVKEAGSFIKMSFPQTLNVQTKSNPNDLVTNIDQETEKFFIKKIKESFPDHKILGEEGFGDKIESLDGVVWIIDPIDGTMNFIHQQRNFAISLAIYWDGVGEIGLIYDVVHDELYHAKRGAGAFLNDRPLPTLEEVAVKEAVIALNATWVTENSKIDPGLLGRLVRDVRGTRSYGSAALEMVFVATGRIDSYMSMRLAPWDIAAGVIIVQEVGGVATTLKGGDLNLLAKQSLFVAKPGLHPTILKEYLNDGKW